MNRARMIGLALLAACGDSSATSPGADSAVPDSVTIDSEAGDSPVATPDGPAADGPAPDVAADAAPDSAPDAPPVDAAEDGAPPCPDFSDSPPRCVLAILGLPSAGRMRVGWRVCCETGSALSIVEAHPAPLGQDMDQFDGSVACGASNAVELSYRAGSPPEAFLWAQHEPLDMDDLPCEVTVRIAP